MPTLVITPFRQTGLRFLGFGYLKNMGTINVHSISIIEA